MWKITYRKRASMGCSQLSNKKQIRSLMVEIFLNFLLGCDASILLDGNNNEKKAVPNSSVRGYGLIDAIKEALEAECQGLVSCADTISMATRDALVLTPSLVDNSYFQEIKKGNGVLQIDQQIALDELTKNIVDDIVNDPDFYTKFGEAMVKLGRVEVLIDGQGEVRKSCRVVNKKPFIFGGLN
ncbi:peroxidase 57-like [Solanum tuberosum]|uniref:peroxidase 57-like n=1 Tax=Solanum tuberosum TaxID=4113 RepID=UPI00073A3D12|nr:PREDICTED: peroxidase 57-like [Solanum tuberosum]